MNCLLARSLSRGHRIKLCPDLVAEHSLAASCSAMLEGERTDLTALLGPRSPDFLMIKARCHLPTNPDRPAI